MPSGGDVSTVQCSPRAMRSWLGWRRTIPHFSTRLRFCGCPRLPVRMRTSCAPRSRRTASSSTALPSASGSPDHWVKMFAPLPRMAAAALRNPAYALAAWPSRGRLSRVNRFPRISPKRLTMAASLGTLGPAQDRRGRHHAGTRFDAGGGRTGPRGPWSRGSPRARSGGRDGPRAAPAPRPRSAARDDRDTGTARRGTAGTRGRRSPPRRRRAPTGGCRPAGSARPRSGTRRPGAPGSRAPRTPCGAGRGAAARTRTLVDALLPPS